MKKLLALLLCISLLAIPLVGCETEDLTPPPTEHRLQVGFGRADITPQESVPLRGYGNTSNRLSLEVTDPLYATCVAFTDAKDNTILLFHTDLVGEMSGTFAAARKSISEATGIPVERIMISGTHTHSAPDLSNKDIPTIPRYKELLQGKLLEAAKAALEDRKNAKLFTAEANPEGYNFVRHYVLSDGEVIGDNFGTLDGREYVGHADEADNQMQLIKITREGGKDIVLVNWQGHPHRAGGSKKYNITADIVGAMRTYMEENLGCKFAYFTGASGNINSSSRIKEEMAAPDYLTHGQQLAQIGMDALKESKPVEEGYALMLPQTVTLNFKGSTGEKNNMNVYAFSIGDIGFICAPYEMFNANGMQIKENSPFETTFIVTCANDTHSYIPAAQAYTYQNSQTPYEISACRYAQGTGETLAQEYSRLLKIIYEFRK